MIIPDVVRQHAEEAAILHGIRTALARAPQARLHNLRHFDDRLVAHLAGLSVAGERGWPLCEAALEVASAGRVFVAAVRAIEDRHQARVEKLLTLTQAIPETRGGLISAFGWLEREQLQGIVAKLLGSDDPFWQWIGLAACSLHRVNPGMTGLHGRSAGSAELRARYLRSRGELGLLDALPECSSGIEDEDPRCRFWASWSAVLLGDRGVALQAIVDSAIALGAKCMRAFGLACQAMSVTAGHRVLQSLARDPESLRGLIQGSGIVGDPAYVPWLIAHMTNDATARVAGESFNLITGTDLASMNLERMPPEKFESGPNDNADDSNVEMDPDDGLLWPDPERIKDWWARNSGRFQPGARYFMGAPVSREHCIDVLKNGYQRQRILAAHYLCLLEPGTPLINTSAPAWRQQTLLGQMT